MQIALQLVTYRKLNTMRTTWLILALMLIVGVAMYYLAASPKGSSAYDTISIQHTSDSFRLKTSLYSAVHPPEVLFSDSLWLHQDSTPLHRTTFNSSTIELNKHYKTNTFFIDYDHAWFYDFEVNKTDTNKAYLITFGISKNNDTLIVQGTIDDQDGHQIRFSGPMIKMYKSFVLSYNNGQVPDSTQPAIPDSTGEVVTEPAVIPSKTISVLSN